MYPKSIEVQGFKSFANKIRLDFHDGITGIVGPNGSGKSNISDAVRWVFGEQSAKQLRGSSMQDVIFAGTQLRKPQSYASVSITLDNKDRALNVDYDDVTVTRRVYRSGESEYILNGSQCRLRDIQELFYDTGIGKDGYSIIGQGQIDKILSGKAEDRRELFDEAAGIVKFKKRKAVAQKKLESERASMLRLTDIMSELERQVGPLARQSETAQQYLKLRDELRKYELNAFILDSALYTAELAKISENLQNISAELQEKSEKEAELREQYTALSEELRTLSEKAEKLHAEMLESGSAKSDLEGQITRLQAAIETEKNNQEHSTRRTQEIAEEIEQRRNQIENSAGEKNRLSSSLYDLENSLAVKRLEITEAETKAAAYRDLMEDEQGKFIGLLNEKTEILAKIEGLSTLITENERRMQELSEELESVSERAAEVIKETDEKEKELQALDQESADKKNELLDVQSRVSDAEDDYRKAQRDQNLVQEKLQLQRSRHEALQNLAERYEGYNNAVRRLMDQKKSVPGMIGVVADLFRVEPKYETAIETALGGAVQNIVMTTEEEAKKAVSWLRENKAGRATFLPLNAITPRGNEQERKVVGEKGVVDTADRLVSCDPKYQKVVNFLLGRYVVAENIDDALKLAKKYRYSLRIVTLQGDLLSVGGAITGGAFKNSSNLLGRNQELETLEKQLSESRKAVDEAARDVLRKRQVLQSEELELEDIQNELHELEVSSASLHAGLDSRRRELSMLALEKKELQTKIKETEDTLKKASVEKTAIEEAAKKIEDLGSASTDSTSETRELLAEVTEALEKSRTAAEELNLKISEINQREMFLDETVQRLDTEIKKLREDQTRLREEESESDERIAEYDAEIQKIRSEMESAASGITELEENYRKLSGERDERQKQQQEYFDRRDALSDEITVLTKEQLRLESSQEKIEEKLDAETEHLWTEYEISPSEAQAYRDDTLTSVSSVRRRAGELRSTIRGLGNINVNAIEQYKEVSGRYEFMKTQYEDLKKAEADLLSIVEELDTGMRKQFTEKFSEIAQAFDRVFRELFGGGQGTIRLQPDVDVIDADISIISQPPGKKLQNMMQLSGGEKALTAIALIFAIQDLKPSPFCLLDEIEAALDEPNVGRFASYLKKLTKNTQFIVITHRRGTMVAADRLYGITMQEKGVSALVSVNLVDKDLEN
ncbi:MAG: chromosome segregation protein SMC [Lachnospiraceae bacterium]|nr:chromosome segregation protein SMC [Lachnospiraceae bacterium]